MGSPKQLWYELLLHTHSSGNWLYDGECISERLMARTRISVFFELHLQSLGEPACTLLLRHVMYCYNTLCRDSYKR